MVIKEEKLRVIQNMMVIKEYWLQWFTSFLIKNLAEVVSPMNQIISSQMSFINQLLKNLRKEKFIHRLETIYLGC